MRPGPPALAVGVVQRAGAIHLAAAVLEQHQAQLLAGSAKSGVLPVDHAQAAVRCAQHVVGEQVAMTGLQIRPAIPTAARSATSSSRCSGTTGRRMARRRSSRRRTRSSHDSAPTGSVYHGSTPFATDVVHACSAATIRADGCGIEAGSRSISSTHSYTRTVADSTRTSTSPLAVRTTPASARQRRRAASWKLASSSASSDRGPSERLLHRPCAARCGQPPHLPDLPASHRADQFGRRHPGSYRAAMAAASRDRASVCQSSQCSASSSMLRIRADRS